MKICSDKTILALSKLIVSPVPEKNKLELQEKFTIRYQYNNEVKGFTIPKGYEYDGASIPILRSDFQPKFLRASLVHDWFCDAYNDRHKTRIDFDVEEMSEVFGEILKLDGVGYLHAEAMEMAVTVFKSLS